MPIYLYDLASDCIWQIRCSISPQDYMWEAQELVFAWQRKGTHYLGGDRVSQVEAFVANPFGALQGLILEDS